MTDPRPQGPDRRDPSSPPDDPRSWACLLQSLLDGIPHPCFYQDPAGHFLGCNQAFLDLLRHTREELLGKTVFDLLPPEEAGAVHRKDLELLASGRAEVFQESVHPPTRDLRHFLTSKAPFRLADGSIGGLVATLQDITDQKRAEEALRQSQDLLSTITRHASDLFAILDPEGRRLYASPSYQTVLGYPPEELAATAPLALVHPDDLPVIRRMLAAVFEAGQAPSVDYRLRHRDGRWLDFECRANPIRPASGRPSQALVVARDVSARKAAERARQEMEVRLRHAQKLESIGSLAAGIAHEINTPTQYIGDNIQFLQGAFLDLLQLAGLVEPLLAAARRGECPPELDRQARSALDRADPGYLRTEVPKSFAEAFEGIHRVAAIVGAMKDFSHPGSSVKTPVDLNRAIQSTTLVCRSEWKYLADLELDLDPELPPVHCLPDEINQVFLNLIINAAHAIADAGPGAKGRIRISTRAAGDRAVVRIEDTGTGIPDAIRARIFDPFFTTKEVGRGTGQGLAIVHAVVVEQHGGGIDVQSAVGRGTSFTLSLPVQGPGREPGGPEAP